MTCERSLNIYLDLGDRRGEIDALSNLARLQEAQQNYDLAIKLFEQQLALAKELSYPSAEADALDQLAAIYSAKRQPNRALNAYSKCLSIARTLGNKPTEASCLYNMSSLLDDLGNLAEARELARSALTIFTEIGDERATQARKLLTSLERQPFLRTKLKQLLSRYRFGAK